MQLRAYGLKAKPAGYLRSLENFPISTPEAAAVEGPT